MAGPGAEAQAQLDSPRGVCPRCPAASARTAGKVAAAGSIKPKCFLFQTIQRHHGTKHREETLRSLLLAPLPTVAAQRDGFKHRAGTRTRGRMGPPQAPCFGMPLPPGSEPPSSAVHQLELLSQTQTKLGTAKGH